MKYAFIQTQTEQHSLAVLCRVLRVSRSGYYAWKQRGPSAREQADQELLQQIRQVHQTHRGHSGAYKTWRVLKNQGVKVGKHRVARLRRQHGIVARRRRRYLTSHRSRAVRWAAPDLLRRCFTVDHPNQVWVCDVTHIPTREGWLYLAVVLDLYSRQVVGWSMHQRPTTEFVLEALNMAVSQRGLHQGLIHHSDRGTIYAAKPYQQQLDALQIRSSMSRPGNCWDNAVAESFFATLEFELIDEQIFKTRQEAKTAIFEFIEVFYNRQRSHQTLNYRTPLDLEQEYRCVA